jgi:hypothetical protein
MYLCFMEKLKYLNQGHVDKILKYFIDTENWTYYYIVYNMVHTGLSFSELKKNKGNLLIPNGVPNPPKNPFDLQIRTVNKQLKIYFAFAGMFDVSPSTFSFIHKMTVNGEIYYGMSPRSNVFSKKENKSKEGRGFIYFIKHRHLNPEISKLLTDKKIGVSKNVKGRMNSLTLGPIDLEVLKVWEMDLEHAYKLEKKIHKVFREKHLVGEWFKDSDDKLIDELTLIINSNSITEVSL